MYKVRGTTILSPPGSIRDPRYPHVLGNQIVLDKILLGQFTNRIGIFYCLNVD